MQSLEEQLLTLCQKKNLRLALAESCTGGAFAARLTQIPGASLCFVGSIVSYQNSAKTTLLQVPEALLTNVGPVSQEVACKMLEGAITQFSADIAAAITGIAGPNGGTPTIPVGTIYIAIGGKHFKSKISCLQLEGTRSSIIQQAIDQGLLLLIQMIQSKELTAD